MLAPHRKGKSGRSQPRPSLETTSTRSSVDENEPHIVLPSSTDLFYFYGQSLEQCAKLSTGKALFDLCTLHKKWLRIYAGELGSIAVYFLSAINKTVFSEDVLIASLKRYVTLRYYGDNVHRSRMCKPSGP
jgi:hypothetical protein